LVWSDESKGYFHWTPWGQTYERCSTPHMGGQEGSKTPPTGFGSCKKPLMTILAEMMTAEHPSSAVMISANIVIRGFLFEAKRVGGSEAWGESLFRSHVAHTRVAPR
jgi:hypothetical protein